MNKEKIQQIISSLPLAQQVGLWVILRLSNADTDNFSFKSSEFAEKIKIFVQKEKKLDKTEYGRFIGGILSGLARNNLIIKIAGDRDKVWTLSKEIKENYDNYRSLLLEVKVYWSNI